MDISLLGRGAWPATTPQNHRGADSEGTGQTRRRWKAPRTLNIALTTLRNIYAEAIADGLVDDNPCLKVRWRKVDIKERKLVTTVELDRLCEAALKTSKNGQQFGDYLRLLQYSGSRMAETLRLRWADVNWDQKQLVIGAGAESKNKWYQ